MARSSFFATRRSLVFFFLSLFIASLFVFSAPFKPSSPLAATQAVHARSVPNVTESHVLHKRIPYQDSVTKGRRLNCLMSATIDHATQINNGVRLESDFNEFEVIGFGEEGWSAAEDVDPKYGSTGLAETLPVLTGQPFDGTIYNYILNDKQYNYQDQEIGPTGAYYGNGINLAGGALIADWNKSPRYADAYIPELPLPHLRQWSQAAFGQWSWEAGIRDEPIEGLRFIIRSWVTNRETQDQVFSALRNVGETEVPRFSNRKTFSRTSPDPNEVDGFYAILGTPNGSGGAFLLATHKTQLGVKRIRNVSVWNHRFAVGFALDRSYMKLMLSFELENVAQPTTGGSE